MAVLKLSSDLFCDYKLIAVHTGLEDYRLAYFLNKGLHIFLKKKAEEACFADVETGKFFSCYEWEDKNSQVRWFCIANKVFVDDLSVAYLLNTHKKVDFFLKIDTEGRVDMVNLLREIGKIPSTTAYEIDIDTLNKKYKLIFQEC